MTPRLKVQNCKFFMAPWRNSRKRLEHKEYKTKYWKMTRKPRSQLGLFAENVKCRRITRELITRTAFKLRERRKNSSPFVYVLHKMWNSRRSLAGTAKKRTKKRDTRIELLFCSSDLLFFFEDVCRTQNRAPFLDRPGNFSGPKANYKVKTCWMVALFLAQKPVNFASLTDSLIWFSKLMFEALILNANTKRLFGAEELSQLSRNRPQARNTLRAPENSLEHPLVGRIPPEHP